MASVRKRTSGSGETTYAVLYRHGTKQPSMTFATEKAAEDVKVLINTLGVERALKALAAEETGGGLTVDQLAAKFLAWKAEDVTARTTTGYQRDYDNWIQPYLGHRAAELVDETDVQEWVDKMKATKRLSPKSIADRHAILHAMYQYGKAKTRKLVTHNPCLETDLPKRTKKPPKGTTVPEYRAILDAAQRRNPDAADLITFFGETGWRFSEGTALDFREVEDDGVDVWVTVSQVFRIDGSGRQVLTADEAKSWRAFRRIRLFPASAAVVRRRVVGKRAGDLVFLNSRGRLWNQNTFLRETWPRILKDAGMLNANGESTTDGRKPTPHWLRHMHVAVLGAAGVPIQEIQRRIGHESIQTTINVYGGMIGDISDDSLGRSAEIMAGRRSAPGIAPVVVGQVIAGELAAAQSEG